MAKVKRGAGLTERMVNVPETEEEYIARWKSFSAQIPVRMPGDWAGDGLRRENAKLCQAILAHAGLTDDGMCAVDTGPLAAKGLTENSAEWIAAHWLAEYNALKKCRERCGAGDMTPRVRTH